MPPQPNTATLVPGATRAARSTAPTPVATAQPMTAATSKGTPSGSGTAPPAGTTA